MPRFQCLLYWNVDKKQWRSESYLKGLSKSFYLYITELHRWLVQCFVVVVVQLLSRVWLFVTPWTADTKHLWPPPSPRVCPNSCLLSRWCYLTILSSAAHFTFCLQSFPAWRFFPKSQLFASGGHKSMPSSLFPLPQNLLHIHLFFWIYFKKGWEKWASSNLLFTSDSNVSLLPSNWKLKTRRPLTKCGPLEKGMANHFSILALRTPWTGRKIWHWKMNSSGR